MNLIYDAIRLIGLNAETFEYIIVIIGALYESKIFGFIPLANKEIKFLGKPGNLRRTLLKYAFLGFLLIGNQVIVYLLTRIVLRLLPKRVAKWIIGAIKWILHMK